MFRHELTGLNNYYTKSEVNNSLALKGPINNPKFTGTVLVNGTLVWPQLTSWPTPQLKGFNIFKASGLYHYGSYGSVTGLVNAPTNSANFRSIEIGNDNRCSQIAMPWDTDQIFFRGKPDRSFSNWLEVVRSGNINTFTSGIQTALNLKAPLASPAFPGSSSTTGDVTCSNDTATSITANKSLTI